MTNGIGTIGELTLLSALVATNKEVITRTKTRRLAAFFVETPAGLGSPFKYRFNNDPKPGCKSRETWSWTCS